MNLARCVTDSSAVSVLVQRQSQHTVTVPFTVHRQSQNTITVAFAVHRQSQHTVTVPFAAQLIISQILCHYSKNLDISLILITLLNRLSSKCTVSLQLSVSVNLHGHYRNYAPSLRRRCIKIYIVLCSWYSYCGGSSC